MRIPLRGLGQQGGDLLATEPRPLLERPRDALDIGPMELDQAHDLRVQPRWPLTKTAKGIGIEWSSNLSRGWTEAPKTLTFLGRAPVAQLDRASDFGSEGWGFDSLRARQ
jgi:hypothetical protein